MNLLPVSQSVREKTRTACSCAPAAARFGVRYAVLRILASPARL